MNGYRSIWNSRWNPKEPSGSTRENCADVRQRTQGLNDEYGFLFFIFDNKILILYSNCDLELPFICSFGGIFETPSPTITPTLYAVFKTKRIHAQKFPFFWYKIVLRQKLQHLNRPSMF